MSGRILVIRPGDAAPSRDNEVTRKPPLRELQRLVGGNIEHVAALTVLTIVEQPPPPCVAYINESGKLLRLRPNVLATRMWYQALGVEDAMTMTLGQLARLYDTKMHDGIVGPMVILTGDAAFMRRL